MARSARLIVPGFPHHVFQQGNNRQKVFRDDEDYMSYLEWLKEAARLYRVDVHAYALLDNGVHLLVTPVDEVRPCPHDAVDRASLCTLFQQKIPAQRYVVGRPVQDIPLLRKTG